MRTVGVSGEPETSVPLQPGGRLPLCSHRPADPAVLAWPRPGQHRHLVVTLASPGCGFVLGNRLGRLPGQESEQAPGVGDGQGSLACCSPGGRKELNATERLN